METLEGVVERITYASAEDGYTVARVAVAGRPAPITVVGAMPGLHPGQALRLTGEWTRHARFGEQFRVSAWEVLTPATRVGIERYLGSGLIKGVGPVTARRLVERFGEETLRVIEQEPERLREVSGVGPDRVARIRTAWDAQREVREVMLFLQGHGVSAAYAGKIFKTYGRGAVALVRENPYRLARDIYGIGFKTADGIAARLGVSPDAPVRLEAGLLHVLGSLTEEGHCCYPREGLLKAAAEVLQVPPGALEAPLTRLAEAADLVVEPGEEEPVVFPRDLYEAEAALARRLGEFLRAPRFGVALDAARALSWVEGQTSLVLAPRQKEALAAALGGKAVVITGGPGTGKTTILRCLLTILERKGLRTLLTAPTGRAAKRMSEATGRPAQTVHRLLEFSPREGTFRRTAARPLSAEAVIVDEVSMADLPLMHRLVEALPPEALLVLVGDVDQLPSVGPGAVLADCIASGVLPVVRLQEVFRQAEQSLIVQNAHRVNRGEMPLLEEAGDFQFLEEDDPDRLAALVVETVAHVLPARHQLHPVEDIQVLAPMHRGIVGVTALNQALQAALNPSGPALARGERVLRAGDKVMQLRNNYETEVFNGDIGRVARVDPEEGTLAVRFEDREVPYEAADLNELILAYAVSVHKSQGSEYPAVLLPLHTQHFIMLRRNLLYTAITRGRRLDVLAGSRRALAIAVKTAPAEGRYTRLAARLRAAAQRREA
jgi:exodeoxyribonuclease V alpha subunit